MSICVAVTEKSPVLPSGFDHRRLRALTFRPQPGGLHQLARRGSRDQPGAIHGLPRIIPHTVERSKVSRFPHQQIIPLLTLNLYFYDRDHCPYMFLMDEFIQKKYIDG